MKLLAALALSGLITILAPLHAEEKPITRIAFGSCSKEDKKQPIWDEIIDEKPEVFIYAGDNIYADTTDTLVMQAKYDKLAAQPGFAKLRRKARVLATWDDHDFGQNDAGAENPIRAESQRIFLDFFGVPASDPRRTREGIYHAEDHGPDGRRVQFILLDTRYHRTGLDRRQMEVNGRKTRGYVESTAAGATFLGEEQWRWLEEQLLQPAEVRLIVSSIQVVAEDHLHEKWSNLPAERQRLFDLLKSTGATGVIFLSGDRHHGELSVMNAGIGYPVYDLTSSGLTQASTTFRYPEKNRHRLAGMPWGLNYGTIGIDWDDEPTVSLQLHDEEGRVRVREIVDLGLLKKQKPKAK